MSSYYREALHQRWRSLTGRLRHTQWPADRFIIWLGPLISEEINVMGRSKTITIQYSHFSQEKPGLLREVTFLSKVG